MTCAVIRTGGASPDSAVSRWFRSRTPAPRSWPVGGWTVPEAIPWPKSAGLGNPNVHDHGNLPLAVIDETGSLAGGRHWLLSHPKPIGVIPGVDLCLGPAGHALRTTIKLQ